MSTRYWIFVVLALFSLTIGCSKPSGEPPEGVDTEAPDLDITEGNEVPASDVEQASAQDDQQGTEAADSKESIEEKKEEMEPVEQVKAAPGPPELNPPVATKPVEPKKVEPSKVEPKKVEAKAPEAPKPEVAPKTGPAKTEAKK